MAAHQLPGGKHEQGFSLTELMIALMVFTLIIGSVITLLVKSQTIFQTEQGVSEMDQNARLMIDFLTRDIQQSKENALGISPKFRSIYSNNGPNGKTDEITIVSADTDSKIPSAALPLMAASRLPFSVSGRTVEVVPNGAAHAEPADVVSSLVPNEQFIVSAVREGGEVQFDFVKSTGARLTDGGGIAIDFEPVEHRGVQSEIPFGSLYEDGSFSMRPVQVKRYFIDPSADAEHPQFSMSVDNGPPIPISRNVVAFQLRYLEIKEGDVEGTWVREQTLDHNAKTEAVEVTLTARTEILGNQRSERLVTLASVIKPRAQPDVGSPFGSVASGRGSPGTPLDGIGGDVSGGPTDGLGDGFGGGNRGAGSASGGFDDGASSLGGAGYRRETRRIGRNGPRLGQRLNERR